MLNLQCFNSARGGVEMSTHNLVKTKSHLKKLSIQECVFSSFFKKKKTFSWLFIKYIQI